MAHNPFFRIPAGEITPPLDAVLMSSVGSIVNLTGATVKARLFELTGDFIAERAATVVSAPGGQVRYQWVAGDIGDPGTKTLVKFRVTYSTLEQQDFPSDRYIEAEATADTRTFGQGTFGSGTF